MAEAPTVRAAVQAEALVETPEVALAEAVDKLAGEALGGLVRVTAEDLERVAALEAQGLDLVDARLAVGTVEGAAENTSSLVTRWSSSINYYEGTKKLKHCKQPWWR